jgi:hypothetical protein
VKAPALLGQAARAHGAAKDFLEQNRRHDCVLCTGKGAKHALNSASLPFARAF